MPKSKHRNSKKRAAKAAARRPGWRPPPLEMPDFGACDFCGEPAASRLELENVDKEFWAMCAACGDLAHTIHRQGEQYAVETGEERERVGAVMLRAAVALGEGRREFDGGDDPVQRLGRRIYERRAAAAGNSINVPES